MTQFLLTLFVCGEAASSRRAKENLARLKTSHLPPSAEMTVIDVLTDPTRAEEAQVLATPTLVFSQSSGQRRFIGDLGDLSRLVDFLGTDRMGDRA